MFFFMPIIFYYPEGFEVRTSLEVEGKTSCCTNYIHGLCFFPALTKSRVQQPGCQGQGGELAPHQILSWLQKNSIIKDFSGLKKIESSSRDSRDREVSWLLTSSSLEARTGLTQRHLVRKIRLLHPQHLDRIWIRQDQYRLPLAPINEFPEPWSWKTSGRVIEGTYHS